MVVFGLISQILDSLLIKISVFAIETGTKLIFKSVGGILYILLPKSVNKTEPQMITITNDEYERLKLLSSSTFKDEWELINSKS